MAKPFSLSRLLERRFEPGYRRSKRKRCFSYSFSNATQVPGKLRNRLGGSSLFLSKAPTLLARLVDTFFWATAVVQDFSFLVERRQSSGLLIQDIHIQIASGVDKDWSFLLTAYSLFHNLLLPLTYVTSSGTKGLSRGSSEFVC